MTVFGNASSRRTARNDLVVVPDTCGAPPGRRPSGYEDVRWKRVISAVIAAPVAHGSIVPFDRRQNARASAKAGKRIRHTDDFPRMTEIRIDGLTGSGEGFRGSAAAGGQGDGHDAKAEKRRPGSGGIQRQVPGLALPTDFDRSLRLLDDVQLDRLERAVVEEARRRGLDLPSHSPEPGHRVERPEPPKPASAESSAANRAAPVTPGQERPILAAFQAGPEPVAITREFRLSRSTVQHVITATERERRKTER